MATSGASDTDHDLLEGFLRRLRVLLEKLLYRRRPLVSALDLQLLRQAWTELEEERRFERVQELIRVGDYDSRLFDHGLHGRQLELKLGLFDRAVHELERKEKRRLFGSRGSKKFWKWALKAANVIVDSVAAAVPPAGAINEFKDATEVALEAPTSVRERVGHLAGSLKLPRRGSRGAQPV